MSLSAMLVDLSLKVGEATAAVAECTQDIGMIIGAVNDSSELAAAVQGDAGESETMQSVSALLAEAIASVDQAKGSLTLAANNLAASNEKVQEYIRRIAG